MGAWIMAKDFIITIDTEGDNLWGWKEGTEITTKNTLFVPRFQELCEKYGFIPTYLCNWEIVNDQWFVDYLKEKMNKGLCEIGMHLHAWNTPPEFELPGDNTSRKPFLIEYPEEVMRQKISTMTDLIERKFNHRPVVHRAGRWAMDDRYYKLLKEFNYIADCSVTPYVSWGNQRGRTPGVVGTDYRNENYNVSLKHGILEVPVSTLWSHRMFIWDKNTWKRKFKEFDYFRKGRALWLRPTGRNCREMCYLIKQYNKSGADHLMFMLHSSELMPGGSPNFKTEKDIEVLYEHFKTIFDAISKYYRGIGLEKYATKKLEFMGTMEL